MRVAVAHNAVGTGAGAAELDVLVQVEAVSTALAQLGCEVWPVACHLDLESLRRNLEGRRPELVFNLVESLGGHDRLIHLVPALLEALGVPFTGSPAEALRATTDKLGAKRALAAAGLPTPSVAAAWPRRGVDAVSEAVPEGRRWIVKSQWEHGSLALNDRAVVASAQVARRLSELAPSLGGSCFAEEYIAGREFNLSMLAGAGAPRLLPPAEMLFVDYPDGKPHIVGAAAKWQEGTFEYRNTRHRFDFPAQDQDLLAELGRLAKACWELFGLAGWARVDFRVDGAGRPFILEINANPCLAPDAGFARALERAGLSFADGIDGILGAATAGRGASAHPFLQASVH